MTTSLTKRLFLALFGAACCCGLTVRAAVTPSEISVTLKPAHDVFVEGERMRVIVDIKNTSPDVIDCRGAKAPDTLVIELYRTSDRYQFDKISKGPFTADFALLSGEGQKLEAFLGDHFAFAKPTRYFARAVLVHGGVRFESPLRTFDVVPGMTCGGALQMFEGHDGLKRKFELVHWSRNRIEHLFLKVQDLGASTRRWATADLGPLLRVTRPKVSVLPTGEVITLHRATQDSFIRTEFWSLPSVFEFHENEVMMDPDVAGAERVKALYKESGGVEAVKKAWWKFW